MQVRNFDFPLAMQSSWVSRFNFCFIANKTFDVLFSLQSFSLCMVLLFSLCVLTILEAL